MPSVFFQSRMQFDRLRTQSILLRNLSFLRFAELLRSSLFPYFNHAYGYFMALLYSVNYLTNLDQFLLSRLKEY